MSTTTPNETSSGAAQAHRVVDAVREYGIAIFLVLLLVVLALTSDVFLTTNNLRNVVEAAVPMGLVAIGGTLVIIAGGFDLSAGAILTVGAVTGALVSNAASPWVGVLAGLGAGVGLGLFNGLLVTVGRVNAFVGTLATSIGFAGLAVALCSSSIVLISDESFGDLAGTKVAGIKSATLILVASALLLAFLLNRTVFGRYIFGIGGNATAARLSGVPSTRTIATTYVLSGFFAALGGVIVASRAGTVSGTTGGTIIYDALAAILIGGNSVLGGEGAIWRTTVGVAILALIANGANLNGVDPLYQQILTGVIILVAVGMEAWTRRSAR